MRFLSLTLLYCLLSAFCADYTLESPTPSSAKNSTSVTSHTTITNDVVPGASKIIYQSIDGGQTWQDISSGLPDSEQPEDFFASDSDLYMRTNNVMYRSKSNLMTPVWEKDDALDAPGASIAFNRSGIMAYNYDGQIFQKTPAGDTWMPILTNFKQPSMRTIFETADGSMFLGYDHGLYKITDNGKNRERVQHEGWVMKIVEADGVLIATGQKGIMRSTDKGENWQWVIREGGVGIAIECIEGGFAAIAFNTTTNSRRIFISMDTGKTWKAIGEGLRPSLSVSSIKQVGNYLLCGHPDGVFRSSDMGKTWTMVHAGIDDVNYGKIQSVFAVVDARSVFRIYVSGNIVYAVAGSAGC